MSALPSHDPDPRAPIRVLIADDHALYREALAAVVALADDLTLAGVASDGREALDLIGRLRPDVALLDVRMAVLSGPVVARRVAETCVPTRVVLLSGSADLPLAAGCGVLSKDATLREIHDAIRAAVAVDRAAARQRRSA